MTSAHTGPARVVDSEGARLLAEQYNLPPIEVDAALFGESTETAHAILGWIDRQERVLTDRHGLLEGRRRYRPVRMLRNWARKHEAGRRRNSGTGGSRHTSGQTET